MKEKLEQWIRKHKILFVMLLILACCTILGAIIIALNWDVVKGVIKSAKPDLQKIETIGYSATQLAATCLSKEIQDSLTGEKLTPRALGAVVGLSAQEINKRLTAAKLQEKRPWGYAITETGRMLGVTTEKITKYDHPFSNIEWDKKVLEVIFTADELAARKAEQERINNISSTW